MQREMEREIEIDVFGGEHLLCLDDMLVTLFWIVCLAGSSL